MIGEGSSICIYIPYIHRLFGYKMHCFSIFISILIWLGFQDGLSQYKVIISHMLHPNIGWSEVTNADLKLPQVMGVSSIIQSSWMTIAIETPMGQAPPGVAADRFKVLKMEAVGSQWAKQRSHGKILGISRDFRGISGDFFDDVHWFISKKWWCSTGISIGVHARPLEWQWIGGTVIAFDQVCISRQVIQISTIFGLSNCHSGYLIDQIPKFVS